jgi:hypothetical protein
MALVKDSRANEVPRKAGLFTQVIASKLPLKFQSRGGEYPLAAKLQDEI